MQETGHRMGWLRKRK